MIKAFVSLVSLVCLGLTALGLSGCSPLALFDALGPRDKGGRLAIRDAAYGADPRQRLDVFVPTVPVERAPVLVFFYGGSWNSGSKDDYAFAAQALAAQGFVTVLPDYRLYPKVRFPDFLKDGAAAIAWVRDNIAAQGGDPSRIVLAGHSAGAYNAAMLGLDPEYLRQAGVDPRIIRAVAGLSGPYDFLPFDQKTSIDVFGQAPDPEATQPVSYAGAHSPPTFLATGDKDTVVRPRNTASLAARLRDARVPVQERVYEGLDHADTLLSLSVSFRRKAPVLAEMSAFLHQHAGARRLTTLTMH
ncbi:MULTISPECIES: alpha/beta hydrolase [Methylorubrum]|jgi:acetyl esterase/lipase|uniref:Alpha/beta hydrolase protein n=4 Tax=Methylorubrum extorquens TaxID=408 RepID=C5B1L2_METEA|nr:MULTISPECIES: alpha/beta hydrolase [Methylobacteriaceae]ACK83053.1 Alpha/beta hydrolase fold-3 domain protein [Methylorubrum extorquens CM4]ACS39646.1 alpha/beta hydrolase protein precursor [Methylorubrum extorquens AM1]EHP87070.1 alpha/beta hydrolase fold-3 domain protein [Methylorubrum extorquens DSM 13060]KQQ24313.1 alpha/beta hydrolase [Methylobacterium sp. Leaf122]MCP1542232.1 acetyl esterase/lipase [Methylorubrum extorquens]